MPVPRMTLQPELGRPTYRKVARHSDRAATALRILQTLYAHCFDEAALVELRHCYETVAQVRDLAETGLVTRPPLERR